MFVCAFRNLVNRYTQMDPSTEQDLTGRAILITGSTSGLGLQTARTLYSRGATVILTCRNLERGKKAVEEVQNLGSNMQATPEIHLFELDLCSYASVMACSRELRSHFDRIDTIVCNAGVMKSEFELTTDGVETHFSTSQFGHFILVRQLISLLSRSSDPRVVIVSSGLYKQISVLPSLKQLMGESLWDMYQGRLAYAVAKLANCLYAKELARRFAEADLSISVYCVRPGFVRGTELGRETHWLLRKLAAPIIWLFSKDLNQGADSIVKCVTLEGLQSGSLYHMGREEQYTDAINDENCRRLWNMCMQMEDLVVKRSNRLTSVDMDDYNTCRMILA